MAELSAPPEITRPLVGVALVAVATLTFASADTVSKQMAMIYPVPVVMAVRFLASLALMLMLLPRYGHGMWRAERRGLMLLRGLVLTLAAMTIGHALRLMPVGETIAIVYLSPFAVMALAVPILGEKVTPLGIFLALLGFCGVLLVMRPGGGLDPVGVLWALGNATCATAYHLLTRALSRRESAVAMIFYVTIVGAVFFSVAALPHLADPLPALPHLVSMAYVGACATLGHFLLSLAYREAPAAIIAPLNYLHLVWAGLLGWIVFDHLPAALSFLGMAVIVMAGAGLALTGHRPPRQALR